jgi:hypothetical protein
MFGKHGSKVREIDCVPFVTDLQIEQRDKCATVLFVPVLVVEVVVQPAK